jgi:hypothetical protein
MNQELFTLPRFVIFILVCLVATLLIHAGYSIYHNEFYLPRLRKFHRGISTTYFKDGAALIASISNIVLSFSLIILIWGHFQSSVKAAVIKIIFGRCFMGWCILITIATICHLIN